MGHPDLLLDFVDGVNFDTPTEPPTSDVIICDKCGTPVPWTPGTPGRKPKRHRRGECADVAADGDAPEDDAPVTRTRRGGRVSKEDKAAAADAELVNDLTEGMAEVGGIVAALAPMTGGVIFTRAPVTCGALVRLSADSPALRKALENVAKFKPWSDIGTTVGAIIYAAGVDSGRLAPYGMIAESFGVAAVAREMGVPEKMAPPDYQEPTGMVYEAGPATAPVFAPRF